jgi:hypothetical protein
VAVATLADLVAQHTELDPPVVTHLQRLVAGWGVLSDLCFADLLLFVPVLGSEEAFVVVGQVRPTTSQTLHLDDLVGRVIDTDERRIVARAWNLGSVVEDEIYVASRNERARLVCIPVRWQERLVAIMTKESALAVGRRPGQLERVYIEVFDRLARMISRGEYPFPVDEDSVADTPRVGDGVLVLDGPGSSTPPPTPSTPCTGSGCTRGWRGCAWTRPAWSRPPFRWPTPPACRQWRRWVRGRHR